MPERPQGIVESRQAQVLKINESRLAHMPFAAAAQSIFLFLSNEFECCLD
jgi:hypothetical protein